MIFLFNFLHFPCTCNVYYYYLFFAAYLNTSSRKDNTLFTSKSEGGIGSELRGMQAMNDPTQKVVIDKVNVLLIGPTGSGLLLLFRCIHVSLVMFL